MPVYIALIVFLIFSGLLPIGILLFSRAVRARHIRTSVRNASYESAEESTGPRITIMTEYIHYFPMFLAFEVVTAVLLIWVLVAASMPYVYSILVLLLAAVAFMFEVFVLFLARYGG